MKVLKGTEVQNYMQPHLKFKRSATRCLLCAMWMLLHQLPVASLADTILSFDEDEKATLVGTVFPERLPPDRTNSVADNRRAARLGRSLFFDPRLSGNNSTACASCHNPSLGWADGEALPSRFPDVRRHTQSLWNLAFNRWFFWDGRADSLWSQALSPIENLTEMNSHRLKVVTLLVQDRYIREDYEAVFEAIPQEIVGLAENGFSSSLVTENSHKGWWRLYETLDRDRKRSIDDVFVNVGKALAAFERRIIAGTSPFDQFVRQIVSGEASFEPTLALPAQRGAKLFIGEARCIECHTGPNFSDGAFHNLRLPEVDGSQEDQGRMDGVRKLARFQFNLDSDYNDAAGMVRIGRDAISPDLVGRFKTPTLRNVALSAPYMHQGQFGTLEEVVRFFSEGQRLDLTGREIADLVAFLNALTDRDLTPDDPGGLRRINAFVESH